MPYIVLVRGVFCVVFNRLLFVICDVCLMICIWLCVVVCWLFVYGVCDECCVVCMCTVVWLVY